MKLFTFPCTTNGLKLELFLNASGIECERQIVRLDIQEHRKPKFLQINPAGELPVLKDGAFILTESNAILWYLCTTRKPELIPKSAESFSHTQAEVMKWLFWQSTSWGPKVDRYHHHHFLKVAFGAQPDNERLKSGEIAMLEQFRFLNQILAGKTFLIDEQLTVADLAIASNLLHWESIGLPVNQFGNLESWVNRLSCFDWWQTTYLHTRSFMNDFTTNIDAYASTSENV